MSDKAKYWIDSAEEDLSAVKVLIDGNKYLYAGFFLHLVVEKALKAVVEKITSKTPPKIHDLSVLAERGGIYDELTESQMSLLETLKPLQIEARYSEHKERISKTLNREKIMSLFQKTEDFLCWIKRKLEK